MARYRCRYAIPGTNQCDREEENYSYIFSHTKQTVMQITKENLHTMDADKLSEAITSHKAEINIEDVETAVELVNRLIEALGGRKTLRRRVDVLENIVAAQQRVLDMLTAKL